MALHKGDNEIVTQLRIMNQWMNQMVKEFRDRWDTLERQHVNDHGRVQIRPMQR
jgi:hypothetical protein